jgi:Flp pilus assembly protein TadD
MEAMQLLRSGKGTEAVEKLQKAIKNCENDPEPEYNLSIALAEILIFQVCSFHAP